VCITSSTTTKRLASPGPADGRAKHAGGTGSNFANPQRALWDASDGQTAYNLTDTSSPRTSRWSSSIPSGIRLMNVSAAGTEMRVYVQLDADSSGAPALLTAPDSIAFQAVGSTAPPSQYVRVSNRGGGSLSMSQAPAVWLTVPHGWDQCDPGAGKEWRRPEVHRRRVECGSYQGHRHHQQRRQRDHSGITDGERRREQRCSLDIVMASFREDLCAGRDHLDLYDGLWTRQPADRVR
jgi:hypothetical protein